MVMVQREVDVEDAYEQVDADVYVCIYLYFFFLITFLFPFFIFFAFFGLDWKCCHVGYRCPARPAFFLLFVPRYDISIMLRVVVALSMYHYPFSCGEQSVAICDGVNSGITAVQL